MSLVLSCSVFGALYNDMKSYKFKSLIWLTWYYLSNGITYVYLIKGVFSFFNEGDFFNHNVNIDYSTYKSHS